MKKYINECILKDTVYEEELTINCMKVAKIYIEQLELDKQKLIEKLEEKEELNDKYLQKLVYALTPTTHTLGDDYNNAFKNIIAENINLETCKIKRKLKECWGIDKKF